jgi:hypothetical protein
VRRAKFHVISREEVFDIGRGNNGRKGAVVKMRPREGVGEPRRHAGRRREIVSLDSI